MQPDEWLLLDNSVGFWRLVEAGYVSVRRAGPSRYEIAGHKYVGRALLDDIELRVEEKVSGTLLSLAAAATGTELRIVEEEAPATAFDHVSRLLMRQFTLAAEGYVAHRRKPRYEYRPRHGPVLSGALDMPGTMRLHATGRLGHFAFSQGRVVCDEPLDRLVLAGLESLERAAEALRLDDETLYGARWLAGALAEVRDTRFLLTGEESFLGVADDIESAPDQMPADVDLARLSVVALLHRGFAPNMPSDGEVPRAWFVDLETLFESAVRTTLRRLLGAVVVDRGEGFSRRMFRGGSDSSLTHPDLVVHRAGHVLAAGDVKYKALPSSLGDGEDERDEDESPRRSVEHGRPDLYQVLVHAASLGAARAFLVYAGESYACAYPGIAATGAATWTAMVRPHELRADLAALAAEIGLLGPPRSSHLSAVRQSV